MLLLIFLTRVFTQHFLNVLMRYEIARADCHLIRHGSTAAKRCGPWRTTFLPPSLPPSTSTVPSSFAAARSQSHYYVRYPLLYYRRFHASVTLLAVEGDRRMNWKVFLPGASPADIVSATRLLCQPAAHLCLFAAVAWCQSKAEWHSHLSRVFHNKR